MWRFRLSLAILNRLTFAIKPQRLLGIRYIVSHRAAEAAKVCPTLLTRKVTPHTWRHATALHLLQSNVDLTMIRSWLGHSSIKRPIST